MTWINAAADDVGGVEPVDAGAGKADRALGHLAALGAQQVGDRLQAGRLAGAVGAQERDDAALRHRQRDALQHQDDVVVDDLDVVDGEERRRRVAHRGPGAAVVPSPASGGGLGWRFIAPRQVPLIVKRRSPPPFPPPLAGEGTTAIAAACMQPHIVFEQSRGVMFFSLA